MIEPVRPSPSHRFHAVRFYESDRSLAKIVAEFVGEGLAQHHPAIIVATAAQRAAIVRALVVNGFDIVQLQGSGELVLLDAQDTLDTFMIDGVPNPEKFRAVMCEVIENACRGRTNCTVRVYGQMVDVLWKDGQRDAAIRLEVLWNLLSAPEAFALMCGYAMGNFYKDVGYDEVCDQHTHILSDDGPADTAA